MIRITHLCRTAPRPPILGEQDSDSKPPLLGVWGPEVLQQLVDLVLLDAAIKVTDPRETQVVVATFTRCIQINIV
jgi:hypothetical protein